jgi:hypothetical protein
MMTTLNISHLLWKVNTLPCISLRFLLLFIVGEEIFE